MSLATHLKTQTKPAHIRVEKARLLKGIFSPCFGMDDYAELLARWFGFFSVIDSSLQDFHFQQYRYYPRAIPLERDIKSLGLDMDDAEMPAYTGWRPVTHLEKLGCVYVIEGSALGAKIITRRLLSTLGESVRGSMAFYQMQPYAWDLFRSWLDEQSQHYPNDQQLVIDAAKSTFHAIHDHMNELAGNCNPGMSEFLANRQT